MIKYFLPLSCLLLNACATPLVTGVTSPVLQKFDNFDNKYSEGENGQVIAFIGEKIGAYRVPQEEWCGVGVGEDSTDEDGFAFICLDGRLNVRYKVIQVLEGKHDKPTIDFAVYEHAPRVPFWKRKDRMIIYVGQYGEQLIHQKYQYDILSPLKSGEFAFCGDPYAWYEPTEIEERGRQKLVPYNFYPPVKQNLTDFLPQEGDEQDEYQDDVRENFVDGMRTIAPPAYEIKNMVATCRMGMPADKVASIRMKYEYIPEREYEKFRTQCWEKAGLPVDGASSTQLQDSGFNTCMKDNE